MSHPPQGYGGYPQGGYPQGGYAQEHPQGTTVLVLGILGLVLCQLCGPFAWNMGNKALREIDANPGRYSNRGAVNAGRICGMVATIVFGVSLVLWFGFILVAVGSSSTT